MSTLKKKQLALVVFFSLAFIFSSFLLIESFCVLFYLQTIIKVRIVLFYSFRIRILLPSSHRHQTNTSYNCNCISVVGCPLPLRYLIDKVTMTSFLVLISHSSHRTNNIQSKKEAFVIVQIRLIFVVVVVVI